MNALQPGSRLTFIADGIPAVPVDVREVIPETPIMKQGVKTGDKPAGLVLRGAVGMGLGRDCRLVDEDGNELPVWVEQAPRSTFANGQAPVAPVLTVRLAPWQSRVSFPTPPNE